MNITIFGAGVFGTALGKVLEENGHTVNYYDPIKFQNQSIPKLTEHSDACVLAAPSEAAPKLMLFVPHDKPLICASKGFLSTRIFAPFGPNFLVISGGAFAADLLAKKQTILTATSDLVVSLFGNDWLKFDRTTDNLGVLLCGSLKNIYAIGSGLWGLRYGTPDFDNFINTSISEIRTILSANGADPNTMNLSCGLNDLVLTCASPTSRNYSLGVQLQQDPDYGKKILAGEVKPQNTIEGLATIKAINNSQEFHVPETVPIFTRIMHAAQNIPMPPLPTVK
jgi:glycerol-3-phosphate dehydrogenase (NAD(P)+)